ncbi:MAG: AMP-dependent synthetase/ligase [Bacteroidia bacterium]
MTATTSASHSIAQDPGFASLHVMFEHAAHTLNTPETTFLQYKEEGTWKSISYQRILDEVQALASYYTHLGLEKGDRVALCMDNCPEYYSIDQSLQKMGLVNVSIYTTLTAEETAFILNDSGAKLLFTGNAFLLKKFQKVQDKCPSVMGVLHLPGDSENGGLVHDYQGALELGRTSLAQHEPIIAERYASVTREDLATLIYTSGTTGVPKGAMLTHWNFMSNCFDAKDLVPSIGPNDVYLSFLPLSHVYERLATMYLSTYIGAEVAFAENIDKVAANITEVRPTLMATVPRLLERVHDKVVKNATESGGIKAKIFWWALETGKKVRQADIEGRSPGLGLAIQRGIAEKLVYSKIKAKMGGRLKLFVSGAGALPPHVGEFFSYLGLRVQEGYGLTETSPLVTVNEYHRQVYGTTGRVAPRQQVAIQNIETLEMITVQDYHSFQPDFRSEEGEILVKGPNVMQGYWQNKAETDHVFDADGWFHTGDIGRFEQGYLKITDRLKNMLKTSLGKNIYPTQIENVLLKSEKIDQVFIIGDKREYLTAIVVPSPDAISEQQPEKMNLLKGDSVFIDDAELSNWLAKDIKKLSNDLAKFERLKKFVVKREPFTIESGEMTITLKVKRKVVLENYAEAVEGMYDDTCAFMAKV